MIYSQKELAQLVVQACITYNITHIVISPGSRNAPLTLSFDNHPDFKTYSLVDERSAAFFALGLAQQNQHPTALICTSGSAVLNYYPAVAEAFYSHIPLLIFSADRPSHLIDIGDGQTIRQFKVLDQHCLASVQLKEGNQFLDKNKERILEAIHLSGVKKGPVHINIPFDEPLYLTGSKMDLGPLNKLEINSNEKGFVDYKRLVPIWNAAIRKMILVGSNYPNDQLEEQLATLAKDPSVLILTETTSNLFDDHFVNNIDKLIFSLDQGEAENLRPEILLSLGGMVVSKKIKQFLRKYSPKHHWHVDQFDKQDTFHCLTEHISSSRKEFFKQLILNSSSQRSEYRDRWLKIRDQKNIKHQEFIKNVAFSDLQVFDLILSSLPNEIQLQLANSSVVRYSQLFDLDKSIEVFCNRGTSGIDGSTSTAIGASMANGKQTVLITGDLSFFYDSNALWNNYIKNDFRIIVINNGGGGIFKIIDGPQNTDSIDYFVTPHKLKAKELCNMYGIEYKAVNNRIELENSIENFYDLSEKPKLLEVFTPEAINDTVLKTYFKCL